jgi:hypothetical protein
MNGYTNYNEGMSPMLPITSNLSTMMTMSGRFSGSNSNSSSSDEYWQDDFRPIRDAGKGILSILRQDENSSHGDLYRRIIAKNSISNLGGGGISNTTNNNANVRGGDHGSITTTDAESNPDHRYFIDDNGMKNQINNDGNITGDSQGEGGVPVPTPSSTTVQHMGTIPLPSQLQEKRKHVKISTMMGLFPRGELAWLTIDDTVYLWSYNSSLDGTIDGAGNAGVSTQMMEYQVPSKQPIVSVGLAPPKPGK